MTRIDIISGFLGAGKTTLIRKLVTEAYQGEKIVLIENEFGEINIDGGFLKDSGIEISEMSAGCICCTLVGDFKEALKKVCDEFHPDRILIEPSGVGKLSDVILAVQNAITSDNGMVLDSFITVADSTKVALYLKNFGEFYENQIEAAGAIVLSRTQKLSQEKIEAAAAMLREVNPEAPIITTPWDSLSGEAIRNAMEKVSLAEELLEKIREEHEAHEHEHHHDHECCHDHEHEHEHHHDHECCHDHEHEHHHDHECCHDHEHEHHHDHECCHDHEHEHHHDHECCHDHEHEHHHHHADEVFDSWGMETPKLFTEEALSRILEQLDAGSCGMVLRAKGILNSNSGTWLEFDYTPGEWDVREGSPDYTGRFCVIGTDLKKDALKELFGV